MTVTACPASMEEEGFGLTAFLQTASCGLPVLAVWGIQNMGLSGALAVLKSWQGLYRELRVFYGTVGWEVRKGNRVSAEPGSPLAGIQGSE